MHFPFRLRQRLEEFQVPNISGGSRLSGSKTFVGQEVHVHHDCASVASKGQTNSNTSPKNGKNSALPNGGSALPNGNHHPARDRSAPSSRPPMSGGVGGVGSSRSRRRSHSSSEGEDAKPERADGRRVGGGSNNRSRELRRGSDSGLWSLTGVLNGMPASNENEADAGKIWEMIRMVT